MGQEITFSTKNGEITFGLTSFDIDILDKLGMETELKEKRIVDLRPK